MYILLLFKQEKTELAIELGVTNKAITTKSSGNKFSKTNNPVRLHVVDKMGHPWLTVLL